MTNYVENDCMLADDRVRSGGISMREPRKNCGCDTCEWNRQRTKSIERINERIAELRRIHANHLAYQRDRVSERDHHGAWDVAINLSETECEIAGLEYALRELGG